MPAVKNMTDPVAFVIMIAPEHDLEWMALLLGASIRHFVSRPANIYFCIEPDHMPRLSQSTRELIDKLGGKLRMLPADPLFHPTYAIGNKIRACALEYDEERIIFLDTDMMFANPTDLARIAVGDVTVQQEFGEVWTKTAGALGEWDYLYKRFSISDGRLAEVRKRAPKFSYPYFNAGVVSFAKSSGFAARWRDVALKIDADPAISHKRPWLDQIALPIAIMQGEFDLRLLAPLVNKRPRRDNLPNIILAHYHGLAMLRFSMLSRVADRCVRAQLGLRSLEHLLDRVLRNSARDQAERLGGKAPFAKVFGERNTGTNLLEQLLVQNFQTLPLVPRAETAQFFAEARNAFGAVREYAEAPRDLLHQHTFDTLYGWKHARPVPELMARTPRYEHSRFLCIYKHPAFWLKSLHARPYNEFHGKVPSDFATFLAEPFTVSERDMVPYEFSGTPLELYQEKLRGYLELKRQTREATLIVPYEKMLQHQDQFLRVLSDHFKPLGRHLKFLKKAAKQLDAGKRGLKTTDYMKKYAVQNRFEGFDEKARAIYDSQIDPELFATLDALSCLRSEG